MNQQEMAGQAEQAEVAETAAQIGQGDALESPDIEVAYTSPSGKAYRGKFRFKVPSVGDQLTIGTRRAALIRGEQQDLSFLHVDLSTQSLAHNIATLSVVVVAHPPWWQQDPRGCPEAEMLDAVLTAYEEWLSFFRGEGQDADQAGSQAT